MLTLPDSVCISICWTDTNGGMMLIAGSPGDISESLGFAEGFGEASSHAPLYFLATVHTLT